MWSSQNWQTPWRRLTTAASWRKSLLRATMLYSFSLRSELFQSSWQSWNARLATMGFSSVRKKCRRLMGCRVKKTCRTWILLIVSLIWKTIFCCIQSRTSFEHEDGVAPTTIMLRKVFSQLIFFYLAIAYASTRLCRLRTIYTKQHGTAPLHFFENASETSEKFIFFVCDNTFTLHTVSRTPAIVDL